MDSILSTPSACCSTLCRGHTALPQQSGKRRVELRCRRVIAKIRWASDDLNVADRRCVPRFALGKPPPRKRGEAFYGRSVGLEPSTV